MPRSVDKPNGEPYRYAAFSVVARVMPAACARTNHDRTILGASIPKCFTNISEPDPVNRLPSYLESGTLGNVRRRNASESSNPFGRPVDRMTSIEIPVRSIASWSRIVEDKSSSDPLQYSAR